MIVVASALPTRVLGVPIDEVLPHWPVLLNLVAGSLVRAWLGATSATRNAFLDLCRILAVLLVVIAFVLVARHRSKIEPSGISKPWQVVVVDDVAGVAIGGSRPTWFIQCSD